MAFLTALTQCTTLTDFQKTLTTANLKVAIPNSGGRHVVSLDDPTHHCSIKHIVNLYDKLLKSDKNNRVVDHASIIQRITQLDEEGIKAFEEVKKRCFITRIVIIILTVLRQFFGNFFNDWRQTLNTIKTTISTMPLETTISATPTPIVQTRNEEPKPKKLPEAQVGAELHTPPQTIRKRRSVTFADKNEINQAELLDALLFGNSAEDQSMNPSRMTLSAWKVQPTQWLKTKYEIHTNSFNKFIFLNLDAFLSSIPKHVPVSEYCLELYLFFQEWTWPEKNSFDQFWQNSFPKYFCNHMSFCIAQLNFTNRLQIDISHLFDGREAYVQSLVRRLGKASVTESPANEEGIRKAGLAKFKEVESAVMPFISTCITKALEERIREQQLKIKGEKEINEREPGSNEKPLEKAEEDRALDEQISKKREEKDNNIELHKVKQEQLKETEEQYAKKCEELKIKKQETEVRALEESIARAKQKLENLRSPTKTESSEPDSPTKTTESSEHDQDKNSKPLVLQEQMDGYIAISQSLIMNQKKELLQLQKLIEQASSEITRLEDARRKKRENLLKEQELRRKEEESINIQIHTSSASVIYTATECRFLLSCLIPLPKITSLDLSLIGATKDPQTLKYKLVAVNCFNDQDQETFKELIKNHPELEILKVNFAFYQEGQEIVQEVNLDFFKKAFYENIKVH